MSVCHASSIAVHNGVVMSRSLCSSDSCPSWVSTDWRTGRTSSRTGTWSMDTCQRMLGTDWPGEPSAASGRPRPSTICEYLGILCASWDFSARTYNNLLQQQPLMTGKAPSLRCAVPEKLTLECTLSLLLLLIIGSHCIVAGLLSSHSIISVADFFIPLSIRMGSFHAEPPPPKQRIERQRKAPSKEAKRIMPTQVANLTIPWLQSVRISRGDTIPLVNLQPPSQSG